MSAQSQKEYMLIFRGTDWHKGLSPEQMQQVSARMMAWFAGLKEEGKALGGAPLERTGKVVSGKNGRMISDGPFAESKEAIGGYFLLQLDSFEEAVAIAQQCPCLLHGAQVEVRPVAESCPLAGEPHEETLAVHA